MSRTEKVVFPGLRGEQLAGRLDLPGGTPRAYALFAHCFTCSKDSLAAYRIARGLANRGLAVFRFDFTGLGESDGEFAGTTFSSNVDDLLAAADYLRREHRAPAVLVGHSLGGAAVIAAAPRIPEVGAVVTLAAPADPSRVCRLFEPVHDGGGDAEAKIGGRTFRVRREFLEDMATQRLETTLDTLNRALLVLHAPLDATVPLGDASRLFEAARHPKSFVSLDGADHLLTREADAEYAAEVIAAWVSRWVPPEPPREASTSLALDHGTVVVQESGTGAYTQSVLAGPHVLVADEPRDLGGDDRGPPPYDLLLAALGACTSMTVRMYAKRKGWPLSRISVRLRHEKIHARDCADCETKSGFIDHVAREVTLEGDLDTEQRERLLEIANKCPVHRTLHSEVRVESRLA